jgi:hypothetical protein
MTNSAAGAPRDGTLRYGFNREDIDEVQVQQAQRVVSNNVAFYPEVYTTYRDYCAKKNKPIDPEVKQKLEELIFANRYETLLTLPTPAQLEESLVANDKLINPHLEVFDKNTAKEILRSF